VKNQSYTMTTYLDAGTGSANGVILCQGGRFGGWSLWMKNGKPMFTYNVLGLSVTTIASNAAVKGNTSIEYSFNYDGGGMGKGGIMTITWDGKKLAEGRIEKTQPFMFSADDGADVGMDEGTQVTEYGVPNKFTGGKVNKVTIALKPQPGGGTGADVKMMIQKYLNE
jgi:hypothetical protein